MKEPYIGITDFTSYEEVAAMKAILDKNPTPARHKLMVGAMMSRKTLLGLPSPWTKVFPPHSSLTSIFSETEGVINCLHYADYDGLSSSEDIEEALFLCGPNAACVQLDMTWPEPSMVHDVKTALRSVDIVVQAGKKAMKIEGFDPARIAARLRWYGAAIDYILIDGSCGTGTPLDGEKTNALIAAIRKIDKLDHVRIAIAGGLGPETMHLIRPIVAMHGNSVAVDAQGRLRPSGNIREPIDWKLAAGYIRASIEALS